FKCLLINRKHVQRKNMAICRYRKGYYMNKERLINEFIELVKVDSETKFEAKINTLLQEKFTALGLEVKEDEATKHIDHEANNLICTLPGNVEHVDAIFYTFHMDTQTTDQPIQLEKNDEEDNKHIDHEENNLIFTLTGNVEHVDPIFFTCHMDTVTPGQQIQPQINDDYITSDGTTILGADDKAGIAVLLEVIRQIKE